mgnify:CR=1 FL=1
MIILQRDSRYEVGDPDCVFKVKSGDLITPIKRIGYKTTFDDWEDYGEITDEDIKDLYIFCCPNDEIQTEVMLGATDGAYIEILSGVNEGDTISSIPPNLDPRSKE